MFLHLSWPGDALATLMAKHGVIEFMLRSRMFFNDNWKLPACSVKVRAYAMSRSLRKFFSENCNDDYDVTNWGNENLNK